MIKQISLDSRCLASHNWILHQHPNDTPAPLNKGHPAAAPNTFMRIRFIPSVQSVARYCGYRKMRSFRLRVSGLAELAPTFLLHRLARTSAAAAAAAAMNRAFSRRTYRRELEAASGLLSPSARRRSSWVVGPDAGDAEARRYFFEALVVGNILEIFLNWIDGFRARLY